MSILAVGTVALDTVETPFGKEKDAFGGSASFFSASARFFAPVGIVAVVGGDFPPKNLALLKRLGVDTSGIAVEKTGKTFRWTGHYGFDLNSAKTLKTELNVLQTFKPDVPAHLRTAKTVFLANIDPDIQNAVLGQVRSPGLTACDSMNYWIETKKKSLLGVLKKVDVFLCNDAEARELSGEFNLIRAAKWILSKGPGLVVIKKGEHGVTCFTKHSVFLAPAYLLESVFDPTGAGDSFAGGFIGYLSRSAGRVTPQTVRRAVIYGSVLASYNVESFSLNRVARLTRPEIEKRYKLFREMTKF